jgi:hypothetical protein
MNAPDRIWIAAYDADDDCPLWELISDHAANPEYGDVAYIRADPAVILAAALELPEVKALVEAMQKAREGLSWAQFHLDEAGMKSLNVDVGLMKIDTALAALKPDAKAAP